ncbi:MAG TPA: hypothetical protein VH415_10805 [Nitrososphaeraceae archaeon]
MADLDDEFPSLVTSWSVESRSFSQEYEEYGRAVADFNDISLNQTNVILFEIKRMRSDGTVIKKTPLLNSKKTRRTSNKQDDTKTGAENVRKGTGRFSNLKVRLIVLALVFIVFLIMIYIFNTVTTGPSGISTSHHFIVAETIYEYDWNFNLF